MRFQIGKRFVAPRVAELNGHSLPKNGMARIRTGKLRHCGMRPERVTICELLHGRSSDTNGVSRFSDSLASMASRCANGGWIGFVQRPIRAKWWAAVRAGTVAKLREIGGGREDGWEQRVGVGYEVRFGLSSAPATPSLSSSAKPAR